MAPASAMSSPHKPRRKTKKTAHFDLAVNPELEPEAEPLVRSPTFPLEAILWPARSSLSQWEILPLVLLAVGLFRWAAGLWGYSGSCNTSPGLGCLEYLHVSHVSVPACLITITPSLLDLDLVLAPC